MLMSILKYSIHNKIAWKKTNYAESVCLKGKSSLVQKVLWFTFHVCELYHCSLSGFSGLVVSLAHFVINLNFNLDLISVTLPRFSILVVSLDRFVVNFNPDLIFVTHTYLIYYYMVACKSVNCNISSLFDCSNVVCTCNQLWKISKISP